MGRRYGNFMFYFSNKVKHKASVFPYHVSPDTWYAGTNSEIKGREPVRERVRRNSPS